MWLAWRRVAGVISRIRCGMKAASLRPRGAPHSTLKITLPIITTMAHGMQCNSCRASEHEDTTTYTSGEFKESEGKKNGSKWMNFIWFFRPTSETHTYPDVLWLPGWCRPSAHASLGYALSVCLPSSHSSHISLPRTRWWQAFQTAGNGLALKWNWSLWNCLESLLIWGEGKKRGRERDWRRWWLCPLRWVNKTGQEERGAVLRKLMDWQTTQRSMEAKQSISVSTKYEITAMTRNKQPHFLVFQKSRFLWWLGATLKCSIKKVIQSYC